jgi:hypothetical protein
MGLLGKLFGKKRSRVKQIVLEREWLSVFETPGEEWQWREDERQGQDFFLREVKYRLVDGDDQLFLYAKDYEGPSQGLETVDQIAARDWPAFYTLFDTFEGLSVARVTQTLMRGTAPACEVALIGRGATTTSTRVRERYAPVPGHMLIVSALGASELFARRASEIDRWFDSVAFNPASQYSARSPAVQRPRDPGR